MSHAHPFTSDDKEFALVLNGTSRGCGSDEFYKVSNSIMNSFLDRGIKIKSAVDRPDKNRILKDGLSYHDTEPYALMIGDKVKNSSEETLKSDIANATREALEALPIDIIVLNVHARLEDTITITTISRPMSFGFGDGEIYLATVPMAFPEEIQKRSVMFLPPATMAQVAPKGLNILPMTLKETRVEQADYRIHRIIREELEKLLQVDKEHAISIYDMPFETSLDEHWKKPLVDSKYVFEGTRLKPIPRVV